jgi:DNA-binding beta-propeller fold protein YncE
MFRVCRRQLWLLFLTGLLFPLSVQAFKSVETQSVAQITFDDEGESLDFPASVFFDPEREELYVVNGGNGRIIVYGPDYFPRWSIGSGRDVLTPRGGTVLSDGRVFVVQIKNRANPTPRITVLNGAFFPEFDIPLDTIPGAEGFRPRNVAISAGGLMYVAGDLYRGVLVLDDEGYFLRKLQPTDTLSALSLDFEPEETATAEGATDTADDAVERDDFANIPEEFRPRKSRGNRIGSSKATSVGPVKINYVTIDSQGRIYMVSPETGKIFVHDSEERFLFAFGTKGGSPGQLSNPRALAIDEERGLIYVADYMRHSILAYSMEGEYLFETGGRGETPGWFNFPNDIALTSRGEIIVADLFNRRVQVLNVDYEARFFDLEAILKSDPKADENEQVPLPGEEATEVEAERFDLTPGAPDIDYEDVGEDPSEETDSAEQIEIEILQDLEIPTISE